MSLLLSLYSSFIGVCSSSGQASPVSTPTNAITSNVALDALVSNTTSDYIIGNV